MPVSMISRTAEEYDEWAAKQPDMTASSDNDVAIERIVNHPDHYTWHPKIECKDVVGYFPYNIGTAMSYLWRCGRKINATRIIDLKKARKHIDFEIERLEAEE